jgi:hypothetical protein
MDRTEPDEAIQRVPCSDRTATKHHGGRPRKITPESTRTIATLRSARLSWRDIGERLSLNPETCRRALWAAKKASGAVGIPPEPVNNPFRGD